MAEVDTSTLPSILNEKRARKLAEEDALRLYNRVRQLQKEEERAHKRIQDTKKKAKEIVKLRERNELKQQEKELREEELQAEIERQRIANLQLKEETVRNRTDTENKIFAEKLAVVQQTKEERTEIERMIAETRILARKKALEQKEAVRKAQQTGEQRLQQYKAQKLQMAQEEYERRLQEEVEAKQRKEKEIQKLAQLELELIERLKQKQLEQRTAYEQLEAVLALGSTRSGSPKSTAATVADNGQNDPASFQEPTEEEVARAFAAYDVDGTGEISTSFLEALMRDLGVPLNPTQLSQAIAQLDVRQCAKISFGEFLLWWKG